MRLNQAWPSLSALFCCTQAELPQLCLRMLALPEAAAPGLPRAELQAHLRAAAERELRPAEQPAADGASLLGPPPADGCLDAGQALWVEVGC